MITEEKAKIILEDGGTEKYTDQEVKEITEHLNNMAEIVYTTYHQNKKKNVRKG